MDPQHSFGGHALDRHIAEFEIDPGLGGELGGEPAAPAGEAAAESWALSQEDWSTFQQQQQELNQTVQMLAAIEAQRAQPYLQQQQGQPEGPLIPDPFNRPDTYEEDFARYIEHVTTPLQSRFEQLDRQQGDEQVLDVLHDLEREKGEFLAPDEMRAVAKQHAKDVYPQIAQRMGHTDQAGTEALVKGYEYAKQLEAKLAQAAVQRHTNSIQTLAGAPRQAGAQYSEGLQVRTVPNWREQPGMSIAQKLLAENGGQ
jgi:hypothetical protein